MSGPGEEGPIRPAHDPWLAPERGWLAQIAMQMQQRKAHPARTLVLLPYAQLMPQAARLWARLYPEGLAPRFETTQNWCRNQGGFVAAPTDYCADPALDSLTARTLLERSGWRDQAEMATPLLLDSMRELVPLAASQPPEERAAWGQLAKSAVLSGLDANALRLEAALAQVALAWAASSAYPTDFLFSPQAKQAVECLLIMPGYQPDPLRDSLQKCWGDQMAVLAPPRLQQAHSGNLQFHQAADGQQEAQRTAACVLQHLQAGRSPVSLVVVDRALTRRVRAMLASQGVPMRDETGWKLSTTRAAAQLMATLRAGAWNASTDGVLDWLKHIPVIDAQALAGLEQALRRQPQRLWRQVPHPWEGATGPSLNDLLQRVQDWRADLSSSRTLKQWLQALRALLQSTGQWETLLTDQAGADLLKVLRLEAIRPFPEEALWANRRLSLREFTHWVDQVLEAASFKPDYPAQAQVVLLPLAQLLGREFAAVVMAACDELRLPLSIDAGGLWTEAQRAALGLPGRDALVVALREAWQGALQQPAVDLLWRSVDEGGEPLLPSPLVQLVQIDHGWPKPAADPRCPRPLVPALIGQPAPVAAALAPKLVSASAYQDLRQCPYRYFALHLLRLRQAEEMEGELDKRDFGLWLHAVLQRFHHLQPSHASVEQQRAGLDQAAQDTLREQGLAEEEFLPYLAAWPRLRDAYLAWLAQHASQGWRFFEGESEMRQTLGTWTLHGRLDRIDLGPNGASMVMDYKTESRETTSRRIKEPLEDTQLAFYAVLLPKDDLRAAYVNLGDREQVKTYEQPQVIALRDALTAGLRSDLERIGAGATLPALGEGAVCETCAARGLCRKDFWDDQ